jgi:L-ascorbate metabolism protein UlaG (beta-lactamase superfamily)
MLLLAIGLPIVAGVVWLVWQLNRRPSLLPYANLTLAPVASTAAGLRVTFLGGATLLLDDGETAILVDGFFTRPSKLRVLATKIAPDGEAIARSLARAGIERLAAVLVSHSHYDHALDATEVARRTGALVVGSASTANLARGGGLGEERIRVVTDGAETTFGRFRVTWLLSAHAPTPVTGGTIDRPLRPPARAFHYREGGCYSLLVEHAGRSLLVQGSAGYLAGALRGRQAEVVFLGVGALGKQDAVFRQGNWRETVAAVGAQRVIPIHWDDFTLPLDRPLRPLPALIDDFAVTMTFLLAQGRQAGVDVRLLPAWTPCDPWAGL